MKDTDAVAAYTVIVTVAVGLSCIRSGGDGLVKLTHNTERTPPRSSFSVVMDSIHQIIN